MNGIFKVLMKDTVELVANPRMLVLSFVVAPAILLLVGQLNVRPPQLNVLMSGLANCEALRKRETKPPEPRGDLGATFVTPKLTSEQRLAAGLGSAPALVVSSVYEGSAAAKAGLMQGDLVIGMNDTVFTDGAQLERIVSQTAPGTKVSLMVLRNGKGAVLSTTIAAEPWLEPPESTAFRYLGELSYVHVDCRSGRERDPFNVLTEQNVDMLINVSEDDEPSWAIYVVETNPLRVRWLLDLARGVHTTRQHVADVNARALRLYKMSALGAVPLQPALLYYRQTWDRSLAQLPMTFSLIVCFLAFIIAAPSLIRERELHTLEILLGAPGIRGITVLIGKILLPVIVSLFAAVIMLVLVQAVYGLYVKADMAGFLLFMALPILSSTLLGLLVSALARSQVQTVMASAIYFFCLLLLGGFLYPAEASSSAIQVITRFVGLTFLVDPANAWFFGAEPFRALPLVPLAIQCVVYAALAAIAWQHRLRDI